MGVRKKQMAERIKEERSQLAFAKLNNCPTSPRKMRLEKLLLSAIANWQAKNEDGDIEDAELFISEIRVDGGRMLKRLRPAPQGRAHRIRKRSNHVTLVLGSRNNAES